MTPLLTIVTVTSALMLLAANDSASASGTSAVVTARGPALLRKVSDPSVRTSATKAPAANPPPIGAGHDSPSAMMELLESGMPDFVPDATSMTGFNTEEPRASLGDFPIESLRGAKGMYSTIAADTKPGGAIAGPAAVALPSTVPTPGSLLLLITCALPVRRRHR